MIINSLRQQKALEHALGVIKKSPVSAYVDGLYLYGSCSKSTEKWNSDVDLFLELNPSILERRDLRTPLRLLKSEVSSDELEDPDVDLKIVVGNCWKSSDSLFYENVKRDGVLLCL